MSSDNPEIGRTVEASGLRTNFHDAGSGRPVVLLHGSGPGVTGWANWRLTIPALAVNRPERVRRLVLMGAAGLEFELTPGLDAVWGYEPSLENMRALISLFARDQSLVSDELVEIRYRASAARACRRAMRGCFPRPGSGESA